MEIEKTMELIESTLDTGVIYSATCKINGKSYIGQAIDYKYKDDVPYRYGVNGRWSDHISDNDQTPFHKAIKKYGSENFILKTMLRANVNELNGWEARIIDHNGTLVPNGYNVARHSRVKNRESESNLASFYLETAASVEVKPIKEDGKYKLVYIYIENEDNNKDKIRFTFGQGKDSNFEIAKEEALKFIEPFQNKKIPISIHPEILGIKDRMASYYEKIEAFKDLDVTKITIGTNKSNNFQLISLKIRTSDSNKETRICFGGKTVKTYDAYEIAKEFIQRIKNNNTIIQESKMLKKFLKSATGSCK
jgi:hypothetical protein